MKAKQIESKRTFVVMLERGDGIIEKLTQFCKENKIQGGTIQGMGALSYAKLYGVQDSEKFLPGEDEFSKPMEIVSCLGNVMIKENEPLVHLHICLGFPDKSTKAGHLLKGKISFTGEFFIQETEKIEKKKKGELYLISW